MPLVFEAFDNEAALNFFGGRIGVRDYNKLVDYVARMILGRFLHVESILNGKNAPLLTPSAGTVKRVVNWLTNADISHRDGWIFQMISWLATKTDEADRMLSIPHSQPTSKGFDCLYVERGTDDKILMTICEDKATNNPRDVIRDEVFPAFKACERGERDSELSNELTAILQRHNWDAETVMSAIESIQWDEARRYRVTVTAPKQRSEVPESLFAGYEDAVSDPKDCRSARVFTVEEVRDWMENFCKDLVSAVEQFTPKTEKEELGKQ